MQFPTIHRTAQKIYFSMSGSRSDWVRLAEIRQDEADESWAREHPIQDRCLQIYKQLRIRVLLFIASDRGVRWAQRLHSVRQQTQSLLLQTYLWVTRRTGVLPARYRVESLSNRQLIDELRERGIEHEGCVERVDLLDALCGLQEIDANANANGTGRRRTPLEEPQCVDKMV